MRLTSPSLISKVFVSGPVEVLVSLRSKKIRSGPGTSPTSYCTWRSTSMATRVYSEVDQRRTPIVQILRFDVPDRQQCLSMVLAGRIMAKQKSILLHRLLQHCRVFIAVPHLFGEFGHRISAGIGAD